jgi:hypothetical protein
MIKALALKELRETIAIGAIALALYLVLVSNLLGMGVFAWVPIISSSTSEIPFTGWEFLGFYSVVSAVLAVALGFRQALWEEGKGTYQFLLHRPASRTLIMLTKLGVAIALFLLCAAVPIVLYGWWAAAGNVPAPFEWSMTEPAWRFWFTMPLLYLGAFVSGLWPARWLGTRLLPLFTTGLLVAGLYSLPWFSAALVLTIAAAAVLSTNICYIAKIRDYS